MIRTAFYACALLALGVIAAVAFTTPPGVSGYSRSTR